MSDNRGTSILVAFGVGMAAGVITALLLSPASGEETRRRLRDAVDDLSERAKQGIDAAGKTMKDQGDRLKVAFQEGQQAYQREGQQD